MRIFYPADLELTAAQWDWLMKKERCPGIRWTFKPLVVER